MNIKITDSWLKDYIKTSASPEDIARALSLHSFSVEKLDRTEDGDVIYEIEVTPNRGDALSVLGIARELKAVLPKQGFTFEWNPKTMSPTPSGRNKDNLSVIIRDTTLVPRFSAIVLDGVSIADSPQFMKDRLQKVGIRSINNVVDITNYMMIDKGQPMHAFDYDKIKDHKMIVRESKEGEKLTTLDGVERLLPSGVIVIEDGDKRLVDLCGIMGAQNSEVDENTKKVLLFVQVYDPVRIRRASMTLGHRTEAALRFEKGIDFNGVLPALGEATAMMQQYATAQISSKLYDIVNFKYKAKTVPLDYKTIDRVAGLHIDKTVVDKVLTDLGFEVKNQTVTVPSWRYDDISIPEDLAEEVIRIYGYYNIPNELMAGAVPDVIPDRSFYWEDHAKDFFKYMGFFECYAYSATNAKFAGTDPIELLNPLTEDFKFLRTTLIPQLLDVLNRNQGYSDKIKLFEISNVYLNHENDLPYQPLMLGVVTKGIDYLEFKGYIQALYKEMGIEDTEDFIINNPSEGVYTTELDFGDMVLRSTSTKSYTPITSFNSIKEDFTFIVPEGLTYSRIVTELKSVDPRIVKVSFKDIYNNNLTVSVEYLDRTHQISSEDVQAIRKTAFNRMEKELNVKVKA